MVKIEFQLFGGRGSSSGRNRRGKNDEKSSSSAEPKTLKEALGKKGKPISIEKSYKDANPNFSKGGRAYQENCQRCVVAYEARRRGYDVVARPTFKGDKMPTIAHDQKKTKNTGRTGGNATVYNGYWQGAFRHAKPKAINLTDAQKRQFGSRQWKKRAQSLQANAEKQMKQWGPGSRAVIAINWKKSAGSGGHVFNAEYNKRTKKVEFVDAQDGSKVGFSDFKNMKSDFAAEIIRTDNLRFSERAKEMVVQRKEAKK